MGSSPELPTPQSISLVVPYRWGLLAQEEDQSPRGLLS